MVQFTRLSPILLAIGYDFSDYIIGGLAQLARALAWHARGHRFDSDILHKLLSIYNNLLFYNPLGKTTLSIAWSYFFIDLCPKTQGKRIKIQAHYECHRHDTPAKPRVE